MPGLCQSSPPAVIQVSIRLDSSTLYLRNSGSRTDEAKDKIHRVRHQLSDTTWNAWLINRFAAGWAANDCCKYSTSHLEKEAITEQRTIQHRLSVLRCNVPRMRTNRQWNQLQLEEWNSRLLRLRHDSENTRDSWTMIKKKISIRTWYWMDPSPASQVEGDTKHFQLIKQGFVRKIKCSRKDLSVGKHLFCVWPSFLWNKPYSLFFFLEGGGPFHAKRGHIAFVQHSLGGSSYAHDDALVVSVSQPLSFSPVTAVDLTRSSRFARLCTDSERNQKRWIESNGRNINHLKDRKGTFFSLRETNRSNRDVWFFSCC